jgi:hypothetical protein
MFGDDVVTENNNGLFILKVDIVAAGTHLRIGRRSNDLASVENLSIGDEVFDPIDQRMVEITEICCVTLDADTVHDRGYSTKLLQREAGAARLLYGVKVPILLARNGYRPPIRGEHHLDEAQVFYALGFERRAIVETPSALCEFVRPSFYAFESMPRRNPTVIVDDAILRAV